MEWATLPLKKYADFTGRSRRKEYWMFALLTLCAAVVLYFLDDLLGLPRTMGVYGPLFLLFEAAVLVPSIAVGIRRLHDTDRSGWWMLIGLVPFVGGIILLVFYVLEGTRGPNQYGPDPKGAEGAAAGVA
jgi:uncharacterized membrane protein YhaH (DUF805 family)